MRILLLVILLLLGRNGNGQENKITDQLLHDICDNINSNKSDNDSIKIFQAFEKYLFPVLREMKEDQAKEAWDRVFFRLQRICYSFKKILDKMDSTDRGDWKEIESKPLSNPEKSICLAFAQRKAFTYLERSGDTVHLTIADGFWTDHFKDGTFSKLKFRWKSECEFEFEFIESTNVGRKNFSKPGDKYSYQILSKHEGFYLMSAEIIGQNRFMTFKLYY